LRDPASDETCLFQKDCALFELKQKELEPLSFLAVDLERRIMGRPRKKAKKSASQKRTRSKTSDKLRALIVEIAALRVTETECAAEMERFNDRDLPEFNQFLKTNHSEQQKELTALLNEIEIHETTLEEAELACMSGEFRSAEEAIIEIEKEVREDFNHPMQGDEDFDGPAPSGKPPEEVIHFLFESFLEEVKGINPDKLDQETYDRYREDFEATFAHVADGNHAAFEKAMLRLATDDSDSSQSAAKIVFRRLARRLHPDHSSEFGEVEKALWNEAMNCYKVFDTGGLETVEMKLQIHLEETITPAQTPALRRYRDELQWQVESLRDELEWATSHPAWKFSLKRKTKALFKSMQQNIEEAIREAGHRLKVLKTIFKEAKRFTAAKQKSRNAQKKAPSKKVARPAKTSVKSSKRPPMREEFVAVQEEFPF
jgi:hypothetical protein